MSHHKHQETNSQHQDSNGGPSGHKPTQSALSEEIAKRAYEKFLERGSVHGFDKQDWDEARREVLAHKSE